VGSEMCIRDRSITVFKMQHRKLEAIYKDISGLTGNEKKILLAKLISEIKIQSNVTETNSILDLKGVGKEIWHDIDAQDYVDSYRSSWG